MSPFYLVKLKITRKQPTAHAVHSVEPIVPDFRSKSFNVRFLPICSKIPLAVFWRKLFDILMSFITHLSSNPIWLILTCKTTVKLS